MVSRSLREEKMMSALLENKLLQLLLLLLLLSSVILFYSFAGSSESVFSETKSFKAVVHEKEKRADNVPLDQAAKHNEEFNNDFHILMMFTNVDQRPVLEKKLKNMLESLFEHAKFDAEQILHLHFVCDDKSKDIAKETVFTHSDHPDVHLEAHFHSVDNFAKQIYPIVKNMQEHFGNHNYFKDAIFFLSIAMHRILPTNIHRIVQLDLDLKINANIRDLWNEFDYFRHENLFGLARENQPVYRHTFWKYRKENPGTKVGNPPPDGITGFNSGVILLNLDLIRDSRFYNEFLDNSKVEKLVKKYYFKGHLGDQDFFTLMNIEHPELFHILDCTWNRQLCQWWKTHGYQDIFDRYFMCDGDVKIWHANCDTPFPE
uniref:xyloside xylosyltransferase 1-like n=1 Tax=Styela clava TaxID=7725 RepID=UPI00193A535E|nr:xyloside xylosyltransferase 1-like [Styela clava]